MAQTGSARSIEETPKYGGLYLVKSADGPVARADARAEARVQVKPGSADLVPMAFGALAMPLLWALDRVLHALHF